MRFLRAFRVITQIKRSFRMEVPVQAAKEAPTEEIKTVTEEEYKIIKEGLADIRVKAEKVFYNPVQEFNRDLSIAVLSVFINDYKEEEQCKIRQKQPETVYEDPITILEALSATGLRSIRYAKEVPNVQKIIANDISERAVDTIKDNIVYNGVENIVETSHNDACQVMHMHKHRKDRFTAVDLDPYGCPSTFLDPALQCVSDGGLLLITATDMAVMSGNAPATCYAKYGAVSLRTKCCHEMALRILLQCIEAHANRHSRYIVPLLSISADFYIRVFVRVFSGASHFKITLSKVSMVYQCVGCGTLTLQPLGEVQPHPKVKDNNAVKLTLPHAPTVGELCEHCHHRHHIGGPIWSGEIHDARFVARLIAHVQAAADRFSTSKRMLGVLCMVQEELPAAPLYWTLDRLCNSVHLQSVRIMQIRSAIMNGGYGVSYSHASRLSIKTDAPARYIWDIMRTLEKEYPVSAAKKESDKVTANILAQKIEYAVDLTDRPDANPDSRRFGHLRFQDNPTPHWGPGSRAAINVGEEKISKSIKNQNKNKKKRLQKEKRQLSQSDDEDTRKKANTENQEVSVKETESSNGTVSPEVTVKIGNEAKMELDQEIEGK